MDQIAGQIEEHIATIHKVLEFCVPKLEESANLIINGFSKGKKVLAAGNGGSAADAQHFVAEFVGRFRKERRGFPAIALTVDPSVVTAWTNDYHFDTLFERQVDTHGKEGDVFVGITTSGNSPNIIKALHKAKQKGLGTIALLGKDGGKAKGLADVEIIVPSNNTPRIQEAHIMFLHIICEIVDDALA